MQEDDIWFEKVIKDDPFGILRDYYLESLSLIELIVVEKNIFENC